MMNLGQTVTFKVERNETQGLQSDEEEVKTLFVPSQPCKVEQFIKYANEIKLKDSCESAPSLFSYLVYNMSKVFKEKFNKEYDGMVEKIQHLSWARVTNSKDWMSRELTIHFTQGGMKYCYLESWGGDSENGGSATHNVKEL
jgi:hypothetical protein